MKKEKEKSLYNQLKPSKAMAFGVCFFAFLAVAASMLSTYLLAHSIKVITNEVSGSLFTLALFFLAVSFFEQVVKYFHSIAICSYEQSDNIAIKSALLSDAFSESVSEHSGNTITKMTFDADIVSKKIYTLSGLFSDSLKVLLSIVYCLILSPVATLILMLSVPLSMIVTSFYDKKIAAIANDRSNAEGALRSFMQEGLTMMTIVKLFGLERKMLAKSFELNTDKSEKTIMLVAVSGRQFAISNYFGYVPILLTLMVCAYLVFAGKMTIAALVAFINFAEGGIVWPISNIPSYFGELSTIKSSFAKISNSFCTKSAQITALPVKAESAWVKLDNISFGYNDTYLFENLNLKINANQITCIAGASGLGKSSILNLIMGTLKSVSGQVQFYTDTYNITSANPIDLCAYVPQGFSLFAGTIKENIAMGASGATQQEIEAAAKLAFAHEFIVGLPSGYNTLIGSGESALSVGQAQRIAIARALIKNAPIIIMDEPTAALDEESEEKIIACLLKLKSSKTIICVSHRQRLISCADTVVTLVNKDGKSEVQFYD